MMSSNYWTLINPECVGRFVSVHTGKKDFVQYVSVSSKMELSISLSRRLDEQAT